MISKNHYEFLISQICDVTNSILWHHKIISIFYIKNWFCYIRKWNFWYKKSILWYHKVRFIFWYHKIEFVIPKNDFVISLNRCAFVISKSLFCISQNNFYISVLWKNDISREPFKIACCMFNKILLSRGSTASLWATFVGWGVLWQKLFYGMHHFIGWDYFIFCDITKSIFWNHKIEFVISQSRIYDIKKIRVILWYDIKKSNFAISQDRFFDITKSRRFCDITNSIFWYHRFDSLISQNRFFFIEK